MNLNQDKSTTNLMGLGLLGNQTTFRDFCHANQPQNNEINTTWYSCYRLWRIVVPTFLQIWELHGLTIYTLPLDEYKIYKFGSRFFFSFFVIVHHKTIRWKRTAIILKIKWTIHINTRKGKDEWGPQSGKEYSLCKQTYKLFVRQRKGSLWFSSYVVDTHVLSEESVESSINFIIIFLCTFHEKGERTYLLSDNMIVGTHDICVYTYLSSHMFKTTGFRNGGLISQGEGISALTCA